jgi:hypothetical protein
VPRGTQVPNPPFLCLPTGLSPSLAGLSRTVWLLFSRVVVGPFNPGLQADRFGLFPFRSPLLRESFLLLRVLRCFSSPGSLPEAMCSLQDAWACPHAGFPIRTSLAFADAHSSPELFVVYHVLLRRWTPRHPPCALGNLFLTCDAEKLMFSRYFIRVCGC